MSIPAAYPFTVPPDSPVLRDLTAVDIPNRNPLLPTLYRYDKPHPHHRVRPKEGVTYVYLQDPSPSAKRIACRIENKMEVPRGPISGMETSSVLWVAVDVCFPAVVGLLHFKPGDALMARSISENGDPNEDALQALGSILCVLFLFHVWRPLMCPHVTASPASRPSFLLP